MKKLILFLLFISSFAFAQTPVRMSATATGTNTYSTLFNPNVAVFNSSTVYVIPFTNANTSGTITLDPDGGGPGAAVSIKGDDGNDLAVGAIKSGGTYAFKFNGTLLKMIGTFTNSGGWATAGNTPLTADVTIDNDVHNLLIGDLTGPFSYHDIDGTGPNATANSYSIGVGTSPDKADLFFAKTSGISAATLTVNESVVGNTTIVDVVAGAGAGFTVQSSENISITSSGSASTVVGSNGAGVTMTSTSLTATATDDINITAGNTTSARDINITSTNGHTHITTGAAGILLDPAGPITVNTDPGAVDEVLTSTGPTTPPIWKAPTGGGGGGVNTFAPNIQTGDYTAVIGDTIQVIYMRNVSTPQTLTIPLNVFPVGSFITVVQDTTAVTTVAGAAGVDIVGRLTLTQKESAVFHQRSTNTWVRLGGEEGVWTDWTPTFTGFSVNPTVVAGYMIEGKKMTIQMTTTTNGTSNSTAFTITNLPVPPNHNVFRLAYVTNATVPCAGRLVILSGSSTITFGAAAAAAAGTITSVAAPFTATLEKGASFELIYEID